MERILGVDVSKDYLDTDTLPTPSAAASPMTWSVSPNLLSRLATLAPDRIVFESTGHYQKPAVGALLAASLPAVVVNARQARDFAKALGILAKTDAIDAAVLARFGQVVPTVVRPLPAPEIQAFQELCDRRAASWFAWWRLRKTTFMPLPPPRSSRTSTLTSITSKNRSRRSKAAWITSWKTRMRSAPRMKSLQSSPRLRALTCREPCRAYLPESRTGNPTADRGPGRLGCRLTTTAVKTEPHAAHSWRTRQGPACSLPGGRRRHSPLPPDEGLYIRLKQRGKASKVALIAVARKLLVLANALVRSMKPYDPANSVCPKIV